jgi:hypothetical protein
MSGRMFALGEIDRYRDSGLHQALYHGYRLRLAIFYGAPVDILRDMVLKVELFERNILGMSFGNEWVFLRGIVDILGGSESKGDLSILEACDCKC